MSFFSVGDARAARPKSARFVWPRLTDFRSRSHRPIPLPASLSISPPPGMIEGECGEGSISELAVFRGRLDLAWRRGMFLSTLIMSHRQRAVGRRGSQTSRVAPRGHFERSVLPFIMAYTSTKLEISSSAILLSQNASALACRFAVLSFRICTTTPGVFLSSVLCHLAASTSGYLCRHSWTISPAKSTVLILSSLLQDQHRAYFRKIGL